MGGHNSGKESTRQWKLQKFWNGMKTFLVRARQLRYVSCQISICCVWAAMGGKKKTALILLCKNWKELCNICRHCCRKADSLVHWKDWKSKWYSNHEAALCRCRNNWLTRPSWGLGAVRSPSKNRWNILFRLWTVKCLHTALEALQEDAMLCFCAQAWLEWPD